MTRTIRWLAVGLFATLGACGDDDSGNDVVDTPPDVPDVGADADADDVPPDVPDETPGPDADADADADDVPDVTDVADEVEVHVLTCDEVAEGWNLGFPVGELSRDFVLELPADVETGGPWPVVFNFHGLGDSASNMHRLLDDAVDDADFPFILVTPEDTDFSLFGAMTIDWDVAVVTTDNREALMFDAILECLETRWGVDEDHVHAVGFSMGSFVVNALGTVRGEQLASLVTYSGAYGNNDVNLAGLGLVGSAISWPDYATTNAYAQVFLHGGTTDTYSMTVATMHFDEYAANDSAFLGGFGHDTFLCDHGGGHTAPAAGFAADQIVEFFHDHPRGTTTSPYASALPADWPTYCSYVAATGTP
ncbi:MAG: hypothetical protein JXB32_11190 [Deltaproteobacteria bacterium]|nr:hypothetical protein [Deltaproteobacteria bacterium]